MTIKNIINSKWHRPNLYITIVSLFLLLASTTALAMSAYFFIADPPSSPYHGFAAGLGVLIVIGFIIFSIPAMFGGILLFRRKKIGVYVSLLALTPMIFISYTMLLPSQFTPSGIFWPITTAIIYFFLILGWKCVKWK